MCSEIAAACLCQMQKLLDFFVVDSIVHFRVSDINTIGS